MSRWVWSLAIRAVVLGLCNPSGAIRAAVRTNWVNVDEFSASKEFSWRFGRIALGLRHRIAAFNLVFPVHWMAAVRRLASTLNRVSLDGPGMAEAAICPRCPSATFQLVFRVASIHYDFCCGSTRQHIGVVHSSQRCAPANLGTRARR